MLPKRPISIYQATCSSCGGFIGLNHDTYRRERDAKGTERFFHIPVCPILTTSEKVNQEYNRMTQ